MFYKRKSTEVGYFRKVNFLVKFFENKGFDVENQTPLHIYKEDVEELIEACKMVLDNHTLASGVLPTMEGFFFGNTDYNKHYFDNVESVLNYCEMELLPMFDKLGDDECIVFTTWY